ncbi:MAG TPA: hypothetical protein VEG38_08875 [Acidimicrobiia bacterium]|nr:hypothetical protein [Acidimicrobiia bacterium]
MATTGCMVGWHDKNGYSGTNGMQDMEERLDTFFPLLRVYHKYDEWGTVKDLVGTAIDDGRLVLASHKLPKVPNSWIAFHSSTVYDDGLEAIVEHYKDLAPAEVIVVFHHEPYGNSSSGSQAPSLGKTSDFKKAFRKFAQAFRDAGADHVKIGYCEIDSKAKVYPNDPCYPGHDVVDVLCHDVYNWGNYTNSGWEDPDEMFSGIVNIAKTINKPLIFGEIGSHPGGYSGHDRGQWIRDLAAYLKTGDARNYVLGFCYYHVDAHNPDDPHYWRFAQGPTAGNQKDDFIAAFSKDPYFVTEPIPASLRGVVAPAPDLGENHPSGGTPTYAKPTKWGLRNVTDGISIGEVSGLASSPKGGAWAIRDSGNADSLYWVTQYSRGKLNWREIPITGGDNRDWEDCVYVVENGTPYIYIHDNRDGNGAGENPKRLTKIPEPANPATATSLSIVDTRHWKFPDTASSSTCGSKQNCEAIIIFKGILYGIQKTDADQSEVYRIGAPSSLSTNEASPTIGTKVGTIGIHCPSGFSLHHDGQTVLTFQHGQVKVFRGKGDTIESLLTGKNTKVLQDDDVEGSFEGGDWFPYQSNDFLLIGENRMTADYDATEGFATGGGIPSSATFGTATVTMTSGAQTVTDAGAILAPGDYDVNEEEAGLEFGLLSVEEVGWIAPTGIESAAALGEPTVTRDEGPGFLFSPPIKYLQPFVGPEYRGPARRLFRYYDGIPTSTNIYVLVDGTVTETQPWDQNLITKIYFGGHVAEITDTEAQILIDAGYGPYLVTLTPSTRGTWAAWEGSAWGELHGLTWGGAPAPYDPSDRLGLYGGYSEGY